MKNVLKGLLFLLFVGIGSTAMAQTTFPTIASDDATVANFTAMTGNVSIDYRSNGFYTRGINDYASVFSLPPNPRYPRVSLPWPGSYGDISYISVPANKYLSMKFTVPATYFGTKPVYSNISTGETSFSALLTFTLSTSPGDFSNPATNPTSTVLPGCYNGSVKPDGGITWMNGPGAGQPAKGCVIKNGGTYWFNAINADTTAVKPDGTGGAKSTSTRVMNNLQKTQYCPNKVCVNPILNGFGTWTQAENAPPVK